MLTRVYFWLLTLSLVNHYTRGTTFQAHLYYTDRVSGSGLDHDCLLYDGSNSYEMHAHWDRFLINRPYQIIPYCRRGIDSYDNAPTYDEYSEIPGISITFQALMKTNVTSEMLYLSSVPIDIVERYEAFLENPHEAPAQQEVYNCSIPWFGEFCQYRLKSMRPFPVIVKRHFHAMDRLTEGSVQEGFITCYTFIECDRGPWPSCLDWREICDGKIDCLNDGVDEIGCDDLDTNECGENEYRCANGFCIPTEFFNDDMHNPDCMDASDEGHKQGHVYSRVCYMDPTFRCEEKSCREQSKHVCGDGQCKEGICKNARDAILLQAKLSRNANLHLSFDCWMSLICVLISSFARLPALNFTTECPLKEESVLNGMEHCPEHFFFPALPVVLDHVRFLYQRNAIFSAKGPDTPLPSYVCYDQHRCESLQPTIQPNQSSCILFSLIEKWAPVNFMSSAEKSVFDFFARYPGAEKNHTVCPNSKPYRCANSSKCLPLNRLVDGFVDCIEGDDERVAHSCSLPDRQLRFKCLSDSVCMDITHDDFGDHCGNVLNQWIGEVSHPDMYNPQRVSQSFATICDGFLDHVIADAHNYTDEINCELWPCNNVYTRCDEQGIWNCLDGSDEADCPGNPCRPRGHPCLSLENNTFTCLPLSHINDGIIDCLGAYDERGHCRSYTANNEKLAYQCFNESKCVDPRMVCHDFSDCTSPKDNGEKCQTVFFSFLPRCEQIDKSQRIENWTLLSYLCSLEIEISRRKPIQFTLKSHVIYPIHSTMTIHNSTSSRTQQVVSHSVVSSGWTEEPFIDELDIYCHRGIPIFANDSTQTYCLCPPAYFGRRCEYQTERVSLTLQFRTTEWSTLFNLVLMLIDNTTTIHSFEQLEYLARHDCRKKFNVNLLYSRRAKPRHRTYHVRIDIFDKVAGEHVSSVVYPVQFLFLPVFRLSRQVDIARRDSSTEEDSCALKCVHGQCTRYSNRNGHFCRCFHVYSGELCSIKNDCNCSPNSVCVGTANNRSICVCPPDRFGPRCYLKRTVCTPNPCSAHGRCVPKDVRTSESGYFCICRSGFTGSNCEQLESRIEFSFAKNVIIPQSMLIHFIDITPPQTTDRFRVVDPLQTTAITKIRFDQTLAAVHHNGIFHLIFLQVSQDYYLALLRHKYTSPINVSTQIIPENRCSPISHLLEPHIRNYSTWYRVRYYHSICVNRPDLQCFYDDQFMCLCDVNRFANCFKFDFKRIYNCFGNSYCENNGDCYQNHVNCPSSSSCFCDECYYGTRCQFTSMGYGLSIDDILGYSIWSRISFARQPSIVHASTGITLLMFILSIINGILSIITFRTEKSLAVGTGVYLLSASVASCLTMLLFTLKFLLLIFSHISSTMNRNFLLFNCTIMEMCLKSFLAVVDWLYTCVAIERVWTIYKAASFDKKQSVKLAKRVTPAIVLLVLGSYIHDAVFRRLLEDVEEQRTWCIVRYSPAMKVVSSAVNLIHFLVPLSINLISVVAIIVLLARQKFRVTDHKDQQKHLWAQFKQHKHYLLSSVILIVVAIPRLVISFMSECMTNAGHPWLYLIAYFFSFVSPLLIFVFFALPSKFYRKQFAEETLRLRRTIQRRLEN